MLHYTLRNKGCYLILNGSDVALVPPVHSTWGLQKVGLHEQRPLGFAVSFALVAVHDLPELIVGLWKSKVKWVNEMEQQAVTQLSPTAEILLGLVLHYVSNVLWHNKVKITVMLILLLFCILTVS